MPDNVVSQLSYAQFVDLIAFLKSLTDHEFVNDPRFGSPFDEPGH